MLSRMKTLVGAVALACAVSTASFAQGTAQPPAPDKPASAGTGETTTSPKQVDKGQNMILPSAGNAGPSAAPTMVYDCQKRPHECTDPATPRDKAGADASQTKPIKP